MSDLRITTIRAIHDALALRGLEHGDGGFIRTAEPICYMDASRLALAREVVKHLPPGASVLNAASVAERLEPVVEAVMMRTSPTRSV